ncbi:hypothetical protein GGR54DRAFT_643951 [Hypoxylon sp. NC1633]|nr:hypothetical protein GGR54DRAFT_643951 [Hypoxylon sp. NC1633]
MVALQNLIPFAFPVVFAASTDVFRRAPKSPFGLYGYGRGIGGAPVFTSGDRAYIGDASRLNDAEAAPVLFAVSTDNSLLGNPNTTATQNSPSWSNLSFDVPEATSADHEVSFSNSSSTNDRSSSGFIFYGDFCLHKSTDGSLKSLWYALPTKYAGVWYLDWNSTDDNTEGQVMLTLKATPPSKPVDQEE